MHDTDSAELLSIISKLKTNKACGYDFINNNVLKHTSYIIVSFLVKLFNGCIKQGIFPGTYKIAKVIPLFKGGDKEDLNSYRPISLLPSQGKLYEKILFTRVFNYFDRFDLFSPCQFGFRAGFSTEHAILDIYEKLFKKSREVQVLVQYF